MKNLAKVSKELFNEIHKLENNAEAVKHSYLLENTYFLSNGNILCKERKQGVSRFPYGSDGFTLWAYSSGYISINESTFYIVLPSEEGKEPYLAFYAGEEQKDHSFIPISLLGRGKNPLERDMVKRYCIYSKECVYYLAETRNFQYTVRIYVNDKKDVCFNVFAYNRKKATKRIYLSSFMNCLFKYANVETMETKWFKKCEYSDNRFIFESPEDIDRKTHITNFGVISRTFGVTKPIKVENTTSRSEYVGGKENSVVNSHVLLEGHLPNQKLVTHFTDTAASGDILTYDVDGKTGVSVQYVLSFTHNEDEFKKICQKSLSENDIDKDLNRKIRHNIKKFANGLNIRFEDWDNGNVNTEVLNQFLNYVIYQTEYCGLAKNSGALFLGVRDVMQQVEAALMWAPKQCRKKILEVIGFIDSSGNPPRQYSIPPKGAMPKMDLRPFIDQGVWIISTIHTYLSYTGDYSILDEVEGYYDRLPGGGVVLSRRRDTVLDHMIQIMDYLITHIDSKTNCLRAMYGDWNDALDGLGLSKDPNKDYSDGVSVMATMQLYKNLHEMEQILSNRNGHEDLIKNYKNVEKKLVDGLNKYAIVHKGDETRILHGWGENRSYLVGSFEDVDGKSRNSSTVNSFVVISNLLDKLDIKKEDIISAYHNLDSKYGIKTFEPYFAEDVKGVGRIVHLPRGTAENGATYIHGTLFGILSLFMMDEGEFAYDQLEKILPITHKKLTTSPFVMPNSYSYNVEEDMDGESMSDWYTGSANTLIKTLVWGVFGIKADLNGVTIKPCKYFRSKKADCSLNIKGCKVNISYQNKGGSRRHIYLDKNEVSGEFISFDNTYLMNHEKVEISIIDE